MYFLDETNIFIKSGNGGNGIISFKKEKYIPFGKADGGNGGRGGNIIIQVSNKINNFKQFKYNKYFIAGNGSIGKKKNKTGKSGKNLVINVPIGTEIITLNKKYILYKFKNKNKKIILLIGGKGGIGNFYYKSSINIKTNKFIKGERGKSFWLKLNIRILSHIGFIGLPNSGKSTLLSCLTYVTQKSSSYPFTTLFPQISFCKLKKNIYTIYDIPGLIKKFSYGYGLGSSFLKHLQYCKIIFHILDLSQEDAIEKYLIIRNELYICKQINNKPEIIILSKKDLLNINIIYKIRILLKLYTKNPIFTYSNLIKKSINSLKKKIFY